MNPRIDLSPGRYQLRIGVHESGAGGMGSVFHDLVVPDYSARGVAMSGLLLTDQAAQRQFSPQRDHQLPAGALPAPATSRRTFRQNDVLSLFAEIYDVISPRAAQHRGCNRADRRGWSYGLLLARVTGWR